MEDHWQELVRPIAKIDFNLGYRDQLKSFSNANFKNLIDSLKDV